MIRLLRAVCQLAALARNPHAAVHRWTTDRSH